MARWLTPVEIARGFGYIRELPENRGQRVNGIQMWTGGRIALDQPWCADWLWLVLDLHYQGNPPLIRSASTDAILAQAQREGWIVSIPVPNDLFIRVRGLKDAHHVGLVTETDPPNRQYRGIAGNTSSDGRSSNGDRVAERWFPLPTDGSTVFARLPL